MSFHLCLLSQEINLSFILQLNNLPSGIIITKIQITTQCEICDTLLYSLSQPKTCHAQALYPSTLLVYCLLPDCYSILAAVVSKK